MITVNLFGRDRHKQQSVRRWERERTWQRKFANRHGYFWIPCPLCGCEFSGAEWRDIDGKVSSIPDENRENFSHGICPSCTRSGLGRETPFVSPVLLHPEENGK